MSELQSAVLPLVAMLIAFVVMAAALFLTRYLTLWLEKKKSIRTNEQKRQMDSPYSLDRDCEDSSEDKPKRKI